MKRVQVQLTDEQIASLRRQADATGEPVASLVRDAVEAWIARAEREQMWDRALQAVGGFHSGLGDIAENHDQYLGEDGEW